MTEKFTSHRSISRANLNLSRISQTVKSKRIGRNICKASNLFWRNPGIACESPIPRLRSQHRRTRTDGKTRPSAERRFRGTNNGRRCCRGTINLLEKGVSSNVIEKISENYQLLTVIEHEIYLCKITKGVFEVG